MPAEFCPCLICGRKFTAARLDDHIRICEKLAKKKRPVYNSAETRARGTEIESKARDKALEKSTQLLLNQRKIREQRPRTSDRWGDTQNDQNKHGDASHETGAARRVPPSRRQTGVSAQHHQSASQRAIAMQEQEKVLCKYCNRRFNPHSAVAHIKFCKEQSMRLGNQKKKEAPARRTNSRRSDDATVYGELRSSDGNNGGESSVSMGAQLKQHSRPSSSSASSSPSSRSRPASVSINRTLLRDQRPSAGIVSKRAELGMFGSMDNMDNTDRYNTQHSQQRYCGGRGDVSVPVAQDGDGMKALRTAISSTSLQSNDDDSILLYDTPPTSMRQDTRATTGDATTTASDEYRANRRRANLHTPVIGGDHYVEDDDEDALAAQSGGATEEHAVAEHCDRRSHKSNGRAGGEPSPRKKALPPPNKSASACSNGDGTGRRMAPFCHECGHRHQVEAARFCCMCGVQRVTVS